ncbi:hypothetical protein Pcinc_042282 [Petrolisthes cinctipes]|uniref:Uncharacterized protein n=1 Tax=Petrolisthes cinctipes TaxID=88211 RepID=A0AAE1BLK0_PETCI|nr:hypothetical protein Pcinc_042282 [Petrolisthes cinctipes]
MVCGHGGGDTLVGFVAEFSRWPSARVPGQVFWCQREVEDARMKLKSLGPVWVFSGHKLRRLNGVPDAAGPRGFVDAAHWL